MLYVCLRLEVAVRPVAEHYLLTSRESTIVPSRRYSKCAVRSNFSPESGGEIMPLQSATKTPIRMILCTPLGEILHRSLFSAELDFFLMRNVISLAFSSRDG